MKPDRPVFRRPAGTPYDPNRFNVRQYEEQHGPGGVPEGYAMAAITPLQSPRLIIAVGVFLVFMSGTMTYGGASPGRTGNNRIAHQAQLCEGLSPPDRFGEGLRGSALPSAGP